MLNIFKKQKNPMGLDLSDSSIKLIQLRREKHGDLSVLGYADEDIPKGAIVGDKIADRKLLAEALRRAVSSPKFGKFEGSYVNASIPEAKSFVRVIQMPEMSESEMNEAVKWEAEAYIPVPVNQVYLDWLILDHTRDGKMTVLMTAAPKEYTDDFVSVIKSAGLFPLAFEIESQATARSLVGKIDDSVLIVDIDTFRTNLIIFDHGALQFTSSLPIAGNTLTESIAKALSISFDEGEKRKKEVGLDEEDRKLSLKKYLAPALVNLVSEVKNTLRFYEEHFAPGAKIFRLILTGGSSKLKHLPSFFQEKLSALTRGEHPLRSVPGLHVELGNPWSKVLGRGKIPPLSREDSLSYATSIGLVLRDIS